ncbi:MAG: ABC transporter substrate-binding protein [Dehalococcoidia bacterium]
MSRKNSLCYKVVALVVALALLVPVFAACGGGGDGDKTPTNPAAQKPTLATPPVTTPPTTTPPKLTSTEPVKIGVIIDYSGPSAMASWLADGAIGFAEWYWNTKQGGINVGGIKRPVEFVKYDNKGQVADAAAAAKKALLDGVVALTLGGVSNVFAYPIADVTDPAKVLFSTFLNEPKEFENYKWLVCSYYNLMARAKMTAEVVVEKLNAKTVGILCLQTETDRAAMDRVIEAIKALDPGVKIVYEGYVPLGVNDFSPYLTKMKYEKPDVLVAILTDANSMAVAKQIMGLGGWGDTKFVANTEASNFTGVAKSPGAEGWYTPMMYLPGNETPAQTEFGKLWAEKCGEDPAWCKKYSPTGAPLSNHPIMYNPLLTAIKAVELAGTDDRAKVAEAARSGKLEFDSPLGYLKLNPDGSSNLTGFYVQWQGGKAVPLK